MNSSRNTSHFLQSLFREIGIIASRPIYFIVLVAIPLFTIIFLSTIFGNGKIENVPVGVVDYTERQLSQQIIEKLEASAVLDISGRRYSSEKEAHIAMQITAAELDPTGPESQDLPGIQCHHIGYRNDRLQKLKFKR